MSRRPLVIVGAGYAAINFGMAAPQGASKEIEGHCPQRSPGGGEWQVDSSSPTHEVQLSLLVTAIVKIASRLNPVTSGW